MSVTTGHANRSLGRWWRARWRPVLASALTIIVLPALVGAAVPKIGGTVPSVKVWHPGGVTKTVSVAGHPATSPVRSAAEKAAMARAAKKYTVPTVTWPSGSGTAQSNGTAARAGTLPVTVATTGNSAAAATAVAVRVLPRSAANTAGVNGVLIGLSRADGVTTTSPVRVAIDYSSFAGAYGGGWADRLKLVSLPACALTSPALRACQVQHPVMFTQNLAAQTLTAQIPVGADTGLAPSAPSRAASARSGQAVRVLAVTSSASSSVGTYAATSLSPAGTWTSGGNSGAFTYSYPITVPTSPSGDAPQIALDYDSGSVDGRTSATNAQASWIGDGWDYAPGYIERSYESCSQDDAETNVSDQCWAGNQVQLSLGSHSSTLVRDDGGTWKLQDDDGTKVVPLTGANNGTWNGEAWEIITPDGTQYYFGENHLPGTTSTGTATNSAWTEPVYCPKSTDPCYSKATDSTSYATNMAWRWNLDYVVEPTGNLQTYTWTPETNYYDRGVTQGGGTGTNTLYDRGGYLSTIQYGYRLSDAVAGTAPVDEVTFGVDERCLTSATFTNCASSNLTATNAPNWPDTPFDQICASATASCTSNTSPSFFTTKRLTSISTSVRVAGVPKPVDSFTLTQMFPAPQAGAVYPSDPGASATNPGDGTTAVMWLSGITREGNDTLGGGSAVSVPTTSFTAMMMANRVDGATTGTAALFRPRMDYIDTDSGSQIVVAYATPQCSRVNNTMPSAPDTNTMDCYPQYWTPVGVTQATLDWFNTYPVASVTVNDLVAPTTPGPWSQALVTSYAYSGAAWHRDDSPLTPTAQRTWGQFRGYRTVTTTTGTASSQSTPTQTVDTYLQGMDGDVLANGSKRAVSVPDSVGDTVTDSDWLQGETLETDTLLGVGGPAQEKSVNGPWTFTATATQTQANSTPSLIARMAATTETRGYQLWHDGTWKKTETDTAYDSSGRIITSDDKGDGTSALPEVCTTTGYATSTSPMPNMLDYPADVRAVRGSCGTAATTANTVSDTRTYYDSATTVGALTGPGEATKTDAVDSYDSSGAPVYATQSTTGYDAYGRVTSSADADGNVTNTAYSAPGASPDTVTVTNPMGWTTVQTLDPARGLAIASTDVNGELTTDTYDGLGRLTAVWSPLRSQSGGESATTTMSYSNTGTSPSAVSSATLRYDGSYATDVKLYDGQDRIIQDQSPTADASAGRLLTDTHYNSLGQIVKTTTPYVDTTTAPDTTVFVALDSAIPAETVTSYDGLDRAVSVAAVAKSVTQWHNTTAYQGTDETDVTPPPGGTATSTFTDVLGHSTATWDYSTATPTGKSADADITSYTYEPGGDDIASIRDNAGNAWTYTYDLHGRQIQVVDPGAGTSHTTYDAAGNTATSTDGTGSQLTYRYDALNRKTAEYDTTPIAGTSPAPSATDEMAAWTYDTLAKGQLTAQIRYTNGADDATHTYTESAAGYTPLYQSTGTTVTVPSGEGLLAGTYQATNQYKPVNSLLAGQHYNLEGGLPKEQVNYSYTGSVLSAFGGSYSYLNIAKYTPQGQILQTNFGGTYGSQLDQTETYDASTGRILTTTDQLQPDTAALTSTAYTYTDSGSITSESDTQLGVATADTQCFTYDRQNRLTAAWTDTTGTTSTTGSPTAQVQGIGHCNDTTPTAGHMSGGPAPYDQGYTFDALGDRLTQTTGDPSTGAVSSTQTLSYPGGNGTSPASQPDAAGTAVTTGSSPSTVAYSYTAAGQTKARANQTFTYDAEGRTASVTNTTDHSTSTYTYAPDGTLLLQRDPASSQDILYLPFGEEIHLDTDTRAVSGLRYYTASPDGVTIVRSSTGTVNYELTDTLKTATTEVDADTLTHSFRYFDPYGNTRGTSPTSWPDQHSYLSKPQDPSTGLDLLGAREYDPSTGRFLSVDPILEAGDARQMNGYSYAADNPVNGSDPTGTMFLPPGGTGCGTVAACTTQTTHQTYCQDHPHAYGCAEYNDPKKPDPWRDHEKTSCPTGRAAALGAQCTAPQPPGFCLLGHEDNASAGCDLGSVAHWVHNNETTIGWITVGALVLTTGGSFLLMVCAAGGCAAAVATAATGWVATTSTAAGWVFAGAQAITTVDVCKHSDGNTCAQSAIQSGLDLVAPAMPKLAEGLGARLKPLFQGPGLPDTAPIEGPDLPTPAPIQGPVDPWEGYYQYLDDGGSL